MLLKQFDYTAVKDAFVMEEQNRRPRATDSPIALNTTAQVSKSVVCGFCGCPGHTEEMCYKKRNASCKAMEEVKAGNQKGKNKKKGQGAKQATTDENGETAQIGELQEMQVPLSLTSPALLLHSWLRLVLTGLQTQVPLHT